MAAGAGQRAVSDDREKPCRRPRIYLSRFAAPPGVSRPAAAVRHNVPGIPHAEPAAGAGPDAAAGIGNPRTGLPAIPAPRGPTGGGADDVRRRHQPAVLPLLLRAALGPALPAGRYGVPRRLRGCLPRPRPRARTSPAL